MEIENLKITDVIKIAEALKSVNSDNTCLDEKSSTGVDFGIGEKVIIRTFSAGVWFGTLKQKSGEEVVLSDARRMWEWKAKKSISLSAVAEHGVEAEKCMFPPKVSQVWLKAIEIISCTEDSIKSIESVEDAVAR